jgi:hypothetical protein
VSVPTLVASKEGKYIPGLLATDFQLFDNRQEKAFRLDAYSASLSLAVAIEVDQNVRDNVPFISRVGNIIESAVAAEGGETALLTYNDEVAVAKSLKRRTVCDLEKDHSFRAWSKDGGRRNESCRTSCDERSISFTSFAADRSACG